MSRSGYSDDDEDQWACIRWRGAVASAIRGQRGQAFLREMQAALDALPERRLIADALEADGAFCAIGSVGRARRIDMTDIDPEDPERVAQLFGIADALAREIVWINDDAGNWRETPEQRFVRVRAWVVENLTEPGDAMSRTLELRQRLKFKGTKSRPKRKTLRRYFIALAAVHVGMASVSRQMGQRGEAAAGLLDAARCRRIAQHYDRRQPLARL